MTEETFEKRLKEIKARALEEERVLSREYVDDLLLVKNIEVGDILISKDPNTIIKLEKYSTILPSFLNKFPQAFFIGQALTKKLEPRKDGKVDSIYGINSITEVIKK